MPAARTSLAVLAAFTVATTAAPALAQRARTPRACTNTAATSLVTTARPSPLSAMFTDAPTATLWVLFTDRGTDGADAVSLLEVSGLAGNNLSITTHSVGPGTASAGALAAVGGNVVAVYSRPDHRVGVYVHPITDGHDSTATLDASGGATGLTVATVRNRALVAWDEGSTGLHLSWVDGAGAAAGAAATVAGTLGSPVALPAFGGVVLALDHGSGAGARLAVVGAARRRAAAVRAAAGGGDATSVSGAMVGPRAMAMFARGNEVHLAQLAGPTGAGRDAVVGSGAGAETAVSRAPWGALGAWTDSGVLSVLPLSAQGAAVTTAFPISHGETGERVHGPALASTGEIMVALWTATGLPGGGSAVRMVRLNCQ